MPSDEQDTDLNRIDYCALFQKVKKQVYDGGVPHLTKKEKNKIILFLRKRNVKNVEQIRCAICVFWRVAICSECLEDLEWYLRYHYKSESFEEIVYPFSWSILRAFRNNDILHNYGEDLKILIEERDEYGFMNDYSGLAMSLSGKYIRVSQDHKLLGKLIQYVELGKQESKRSYDGVCEAVTENFDKMPSLEQYKICEWPPDPDILDKAKKLVMQWQN